MPREYPNQDYCTETDPYATEDAPPTHHISPLDKMDFEPPLEKLYNNFKVSPQYVGESSSDALSTQVGGDHYKSCKIQPLEYAYANGLDVCEHAIVKYITRHKAKGGIEDLQKVIHYAQLEAKLVYGEDI